MLHPIRFLLRHLWAATALTVVVVAVATFTARFLLLPQAGYMLPQVERLVSEYAGRPVRIAGFGIDWLSREPVLSLQDLQVFPQYGGDAPQLQLGSLYVSIDPWALLTEQELRIGRLSLAGIRLSLLRHVDGRISVRGFAGESDAASTGDNTAVALWLLSQPRLGLYSSRVELFDEASDRQLRFSDVNLEFENIDGQRRLSGAVGLPPELGRRLSFIARFQGDLSDSSRWQGDIYLQGRALKLDAEPAGLIPARLGIEGGEADLELWSHWKAGKITQVTADLELRDLTAHDTTLDTLGGLLFARRTEGSDGTSGWRIDGEQLHLSHAGKQWSSDYLALQLPGELTDGEVRAAAQRLDLAPLGGLLLATGLLDRDNREMVEALAPSGTIEGLETAWSANGGFALRGDLRGFGYRPWRQLPGVTNLSAHVDGHRGAGRIELFDTPLRLELPELFRDPLELDRITGTVEWREEADGWRLTSPAVTAENLHLTTLTRLDIRLPADGSSPFLDLQSDYHDGDAAYTSRYLPTSIMPEEAVSWLDRAIVGGRVTAGSMLFHGFTADYPFAGDEGRMEVRFNVEQALLDYQEGWPRLEELDAEIAFVNEGFHAEGVAGKILGGEIRRVVADIPKLSESVLTINGRADAPAPDLLTLLRDTPLRDETGRYFEGMSAVGRPRLDLEVVIPLMPPASPDNSPKDDPVRVKGAVTFNDGQLDLGMEGLALTAMKGRIAFNNRGIRADGVKARFRDQPVRIDAYPMKIGGSRLAVQGQFAARDLLAPYSPFAASRMEGRSDWRLDVDIPGGEKRKGHKMRVAARLRSDLKGTAITLPTPLAKPAEESTALDLTMAFGGDGSTPIRFRCGKRIQGEIHPGDADTPRRAALALGGGPLPKPPKQGLTVSGELEEMALAEWIALWSTPADPDNPDRPTDHHAPELKRLDLRVAQLEAFGHLFNDQTLTGGPRGDSWAFQLSGPDAQGRLRIPRKWNRAHTLDAQLEHLILRPFPGDAEPSEEAPPIDPRGWPGVSLKAARFTYDGLDLGSLELEAAPAYDGLELHRTAVDSEHTHLEGRGGWRWNSGEPESWLTVKINSRDLEKSLTTFGYPHTIAGGEGVATLNLNWPGEPGEFAIGRIEGEVALDLVDLRILELDPGAGRILGLLRLDLASLLGKGIGFDTIRGRALLGDGIADIAQLELVGNAADVAVAGNTDLEAEQYDLLVDLTPHFSSSLPLAGAIAAANPVVGAALFIADKLLDDEIDSAAMSHYTVTGAWDDPQVKKLPRADRSDSARALRKRLGRP